MGYYDSLNTEQKKNVAIIVNEAFKEGITNPFSIAAILAIISKESSFIPKTENDYSKTSNSRIRKIFGSRVSGLSESELNSLKSDPVEFFNRVYGGRYGTPQNEGYKYRGRGLNQLTFKGSYDKRGKIIGVDLVKNPEKANDIRVASKLAVTFLKDRIATLKRLGKLKSYNADNINDFKNVKDATMAFYHANTGAGKAVSYIKSKANNSPTGGMKKALDRVQSLIVAVVKKKPMKIILVSTILVIATWALIKYSGIGKNNNVIKAIT